MPELGLHTARSVCICVDSKGVLPLPSVKVTVDSIKFISLLCFRDNSLAFLFILDIRRIISYDHHYSIETGRNIIRITDLRSRTPYANYPSLKNAVYHHPQVHPDAEFKPELSHDRTQKQKIPNHENHVPVRMIDHVLSRMVNSNAEHNLSKQQNQSNYFNHD